MAAGRELNRDGGGGKGGKIGRTDVVGDCLRYRGERVISKQSATPRGGNTGVARGTERRNLIALQKKSRGNLLMYN